MEALDLSKTPPRATRDAIGGAIFLPRTIDKLRGELPGGNLNDYLTDDDRGLSSYVLYKLGIGIDELRSVVASAATEDEVVAWLLPRIDPSAAAKVNEKLLSLRVDQMKPADRDLMYSRLPNVEPGQHEFLLDVIETEDAALVR